MTTAIKRNWRNEDSVANKMAKYYFELAKAGDNNMTVKDAKKRLKDTYKKEFPVYKDTKTPPVFINMFTHHEEHGESYTNIYMFKQHKNTMKWIQQNFNLEGDENHYDYSPTGLWFRDKAKVIQTKDRVFIIQRHLLDC